MRLLFKFLSLDIVSLMSWNFWVTSWEMDESYSLVVWPRPKSLGSFCGLEEVRFILLLLLLLFSFLTSGVPPNEGFQSRALGGATGQSEIWLKTGA